jgi:predicted nucleic acid-binding protein
VFLRSLIDTGPLVALVDKSDPWHERCRDAFSQFRLPLVTSEAVLTEVFHFIEGRKRQEAAWGLVRDIATVEPMTDADLLGLQESMDRYHDCPMDFADATLVHLAGRLNLDTVFTVDVNDFETYRIGGRRKFRVLPGRTR